MNQNDPYQRFLALQPQRNELVMKVDMIRVKLSEGKGKFHTMLFVTFTEDSFDI